MSDLVAVDASVLVAILKKEPDREHLLRALGPIEAVICWPTIFEARIWCVRHLSDASDSGWLVEWLALAETRTIAFDGELEALAASAFDRFGKWRHPAGLNFGDCMAYAVAVRHDAPLLFKGGDFARTDVRVHPASVT